MVFDGIVGSSPTIPTIKIYIQDIVQLGRMSGLGPDGCRFKSYYPDQIKRDLSSVGRATGF